MDLRPVIFVVGILLSVLAASMVLPLLADLYTGNPDWKVFFLCMVLTAFFGGSLVLTNYTAHFSLKIREVFILTVLSWFALVIFAALPFKFSDLDMNLADSVFESMSGITTTGATVITSLDEAPRGILLWRALLQWMGGIGIIVMALAVLPFLKVGGMQLFRTESSENEKALPRAAKLATSIVMIYIALSGICAIAYIITGLTPFEAMAHAMTTISTGGYSTYDASMGHFDNAGAEIIATIFMIMGGMPFVLYLRAINGNVRSLFRDPQVKAFLGIIALSITALSLYLVVTGQYTLIPALRYTSFNIVSVMTGTGYATANYSVWGSFALSLMLFLMVMGGCAGSTTCGIKIFRFQVLYAVAKTQINRLIYPSGIFIPHYNKRRISREVTMSVLSFFFVFALCFSLAVVALSYVGLDFLTAISSAATAISNVGPGLGDIVGPAGTFKALPDSAKWVLSLCMFMGRLELFTVLVLFSPYFWKR